MNVHEVEITQAQIDACIARMKVGPFKASDIREAAKAAGVVKKGGSAYITSVDVQSRTADRLIQKLRRENKIKASKPFPMWVWNEDLKA